MYLLKNAPFRAILANFGALPYIVPAEGKSKNLKTSLCG